MARVLAHDLCIRGHNYDPKPFVWTAKANDVLQKVIRANRCLRFQKKTGHYTRAVAWTSGDIDEWIDRQIKESRKTRLPPAAPAKTASQVGECMFRETKAAGLRTAAAPRNASHAHYTALAKHRFIDSYREGRLTRRSAFFPREVMP